MVVNRGAFVRKREVSSWEKLGEAGNLPSSAGNGEFECGNGIVVLVKFAMRGKRMTGKRAELVNYV